MAVTLWTVPASLLSSYVEDPPGYFGKVFFGFGYITSHGEPAWEDPGLVPNGCDIPNVPMLTPLPFSFKTFTPTDCSIGITGTVEFGQLFNFFHPQWKLNPPVPSATISMPTAKPKPQVCCQPCPLPKRDLVATATGPGGTIVATMKNNGNTWASECVNGLIFSMACDGSGKAALTVTGFTSGGCPDGQPISCTSGGGFPTLVLREGYTCIPLHLRYQSGNFCRFMQDNGIDYIYVDEP
jgi:hypothetical protein